MEVCLTVLTAILLLTLMALSLPPQTASSTQRSTPLTPDPIVLAHARVMEAVPPGSYRDLPPCLGPPSGGRPENRSP